MTNEDYTFRSTAVVDPTPTSFIFLRKNPEEVIRLDKEGFHYKGEFIADAGEAHRLMVAFLKQNTAQPEQKVPTDEELNDVYWEAAATHPIRKNSAVHTAALRAVLARWGK
jgi:hypothetical protein